MADLHKEFNTFHDCIALAKSKKESLRTSRDAIRSRIRKHFKEVLNLNVPKFHGQGSYAMGTIVNPLDGEFDIDDGVYLQHLDEYDKNEWPTPETIHRWLVKATEGPTNEKPIDKAHLRKGSICRTIPCGPAGIRRTQRRLFACGKRGERVAPERPAGPDGLVQGPRQRTWRAVPADCSISESLGRFSIRTTGDYALRINLYRAGGPSFLF